MTAVTPERLADEPVAWIYSRDGVDPYADLCAPTTEELEDYHVVPLYTRPAPSPATDEDGPEAAKAILAALAPTPPVGWQPIETAPRNGTRVLLTVEGVSRAVLAEWSGLDWTTVDGRNWMGRKVTHWMQLPTPPEGEK